MKIGRALRPTFPMLVQQRSGRSFPARSRTRWTNWKCLGQKMRHLMTMQLITILMSKRSLGLQLACPGAHFRIRKRPSMMMTICFRRQILLKLGSEIHSMKEAGEILEEQVIKTQLLGIDSVAIESPLLVKVRELIASSLPIRHHSWGHQIISMLTVMSKVKNQRKMRSCPCLLKPYLHPNKLNTRWRSRHKYPTPRLPIYRWLMAMNPKMSQTT